MRIGVSIQEAIDWTQDHLVTTRPLAERTLFGLLASHRVTETEEGYMLAEDADEDEARKEHGKASAKLQMKHRPRSRLMQKHADYRIVKQTHTKLTALTDYADVKQVDRVERLRVTADKLLGDIELMNAKGDPAPLYPLHVTSGPPDALS